MTDNENSTMSISDLKNGGDLINNVPPTASVGGEERQIVEKSSFEIRDSKPQPEKNFADNLLDDTDKVLKDKKTESLKILEEGKAALEAGLITPESELGKFVTSHLGDTSKLVDGLDLKSENEINNPSNVVPLNPTKIQVKPGEAPTIAPLIQDVSAEYSENIFEIDKDDLKEIEDEEEEISDEQMKELKSQIRNKIAPVAKTLDISTFTISKVPVSVSNAFAEEAKKNISDWVINCSQSLISMREFRGPEIESLNTEDSGRNRYNTLRDMWQNIYNHIENPDKAPTLDAWLQTTSFLAIEDIFFSVYNASFRGVNYIPYACPKCKHAWLTDNIEMTEMIDFENDKAKELFNKISQKQTEPWNGLYKAEVVPVSNQFAIAFREPSIYNLIFENALLDDDFKMKYQRLLSIIAYMDSVYMIDAVNCELKPMEPKVYPNNVIATIKTKVVLFAKVLAALDSDQYNTLITYINKINEIGNQVSYALPEATCPECKTVIPRESKRAQELLFTRHQLGAIASI